MGEVRRATRKQQRKQTEINKYFMKLLEEFYAKWKRVSEEEIGEHFKTIDAKWRSYCKKMQLQNGADRVRPIDDEFNFQISETWRKEKEKQEKTAESPQIQTTQNLPSAKEVE